MQAYAPTDWTKTALDMGNPGSTTLDGKRTRISIKIHPEDDAAFKQAHCPAVALELRGARAEIARRTLELGRP